MGTGANCGGCQLEKLGRGFTEVEIGNRYSQTRLLLVGEASGDSEARDALPFRPYAQSGSLLADALRECGISRAEVAITNVVRCHPPGDVLEGAWYGYGAISTCTQRYLAAAIEKLRPKVILALGGTALRTLASIPSGKSGSLDVIRGYALPGAGVADGIPVIGTYHPAFLRRGASHLTPLLQRDLKRAFLIAIGKLKEGEHFFLKPPELAYQLRPSVREAWDWYCNIDPERTIYADLETPRSRREDEDERNSFAERDINMIQFTQHRGRGIALPWRDEYVDVAKAILALPNRNCWHNGWGFDLPVLAANGVTPAGIQDDTMIQWKAYQADLPANLQAVAGYCGFPYSWKHLSESEPERYGCADVDATCWADETLQTLLKREDRWSSYERYFRDFWPILRDMSNRGIPISEPARSALKSTLEVEGVRVDAEVKALVPAEVLATKQKYGYKNPPKLKCVEEGCDYEGRTDHTCAGTDLVVPYRDLAESHNLVQREIVVREQEKCRCTKKTRPDCDVCAGVGFLPAGLIEQRWASPVEFNPNSAPQVKRFMRYLKHPIPKHAKRVDESGEAAETTEVKELERLYAKTKHPIYPLLIQKRQITKMSGTYHDGYAPDREGKVRTTFGFGPATWQLNSKSPNVQNSPARGKTPFQKTLVEAFNRMMVSSPGCTLVNFDYKSFHAQTTACEAGLPDYLRLAKIDIHAFNACHFIKHPDRHDLLKWSDKDLKAFFNELRESPRIWTNGLTFGEIRDSKTKSAGLGIGFGMRPKKLYLMYQEDFENQKEAESIWNLIMRELFPGLLKWQEKVRQIATEEKMLKSRFGGLRRFYDVQRWSRQDQKMVPGDQGEAAIAYLPASNAFGMIRYGMLKLNELGLMERFRAINTTHDSIKFDCPDELVEECRERVRPIMEEPCPLMAYSKVTGPEGLSVEVASHVGKSIQELH